MPRGDKVIVRAFRDTPLILLVWDELPDAVYVVTEENYQKLTRGVNALWPVGFHREDVFVYQEGVREGIEQPVSFWAGLKPY